MTQHSSRQRGWFGCGRLVSGCTCLPLNLDDNVLQVLKMVRVPEGNAARHRGTGKRKRGSEDAEPEEKEQVGLQPVLGNSLNISFLGAPRSACTGMRLRPKLL